MPAAVRMPAAQGGRRRSRVALAMAVAVAAVALTLASALGRAPSARAAEASPSSCGDGGGNGDGTGAKAADASGTCAWSPPAPAAPSESWVDSASAEDFQPVRALDEDPSDADKACADFYRNAPPNPAQRVSMLDAVPAHKVAVALNGEGRGILADWNPHCLGSLADAAAAALSGAAPGRASGAKFLFTPAGLSVRSAEDVERKAHRKLYVLLLDETWVWPFHSVGHEFRAAGFKLTTVSDRPRVFLVSNFTDAAVNEHLISTYSKDLARSPERHYSPGFENYRTSETGWINAASDPVARKLRTDMRAVMRLPMLEMVEEPQFLRYLANKAWYRPHQDYFHNYARDGVYEARKYLRERLVDLVERGNRSALADRLREALDVATLRAPTTRVVAAKAPVLAAVMRYPDRALPPAAVKAMCEATRCGAPDARAMRGLVASSPATLAAATRALAGLVLGELGLDAKDARWLDYLSKKARPPRVVVNRFATMLPYINAVGGGGETVFPEAEHPERWNGADFVHPVHEGMRECSKGLIVKPVESAAALFYHRFPDGRLDPISSHGGCPPATGSVKYAINGFTWNGAFELGMSFYAE